MIVEDHELLADTVAIALQRFGYDVDRPVELAQQGVLECAREFAPHIVLLGLHLGERKPSIPLIEPLRQLSATVLMLTGERDLGVLAECVEAGAVGIVHKSVTLEELVGSIRQVERTGTAMTRHERDTLLQHLRQRRLDDDERTAPFDRLSTREREVLRALTSGMTAASIAERDCVSLATVRSQIRSVLAKLGVNSQLAAVALAASSNWFPGALDGS